MDWTEVKITVDAENVDLAGAIAQMTVPYGIYIEDYSHLNEEVEEVAHIDLIDEDLLKKDRTKAIVHVYISPEDNPAEAISFLTERYAAAGIKNKIETGACVQEDWINNWKKYFHPINVGKRLLIRPDWEKVENPDGRVVLDLEPGIAFGTGTHETTRLCMQFLEDYVKPGCKMLDVGCGSGILSVAGLLLGAGSAVGVDIDPLAVKTAKQNAERNHVAERFTGIDGSLTEKVDGQFNVVVANIVADVIIELTKDIEKYLAPGAVYIMSGIIDEREQDVRNALEGKFKILDRREEKGWVALACAAS
jgi:ribosomal protein L11 methyltransferase